MREKNILEVKDLSVSFRAAKGEIEAVKKAGYKMAFTTEYIPIQINHTNLYRIPRMAMNTYGGYYENLSKILGIWQDILKK